MTDAKKLEETTKTDTTAPSSLEALAALAKADWDLFMADIQAQTANAIKRFGFLMFTDANNEQVKHDIMEAKNAQDAADAAARDAANAAAIAKAAGEAAAAS